MENQNPNRSIPTIVAMTNNPDYITSNVEDKMLTETKQWVLLKISREALMSVIPGHGKFSTFLVQSEAEPDCWELRIMTQELIPCLEN